MRHHFFRYILPVAVFLALCARADAFVVDIADTRGVCGDSIIVLDPGHGGEDSGAIGPGGVLEKDVTLSLAKELSALLRDRGDCKVFLTRSDDTFITLEDRTAFANEKGADIFISIHANSTPSKSVKGIETYFLSFDATDDDARRVAAFENRIVKTAAAVDGGEVPGLDSMADLKDILLDLAKTEAHHSSSSLAELVHTALVEATGKESRGVKQAPFVVLTGAAMPAVLVEVGFISNPAEEMWLASKKEQTKIAESISRGVLGFTRVYGDGKDYVGLNDSY